MSARREESAPVAPVPATAAAAGKIARELRLVRDNLTDLVDRVAALQDRLRADTPTIVQLDRLAQRRHPVVPAVRERAERFEGEEAAMATDAWEITLITEEG